MLCGVCRCGRGVVGGRGVCLVCVCVCVCCGTLKKRGAWCWHTRGRFECTHGGVLNGHTGRRGSSSVPLTKICPRTVITCFRGSPKKLLDLSYFQV